MMLPPDLLHDVTYKLPWDATFDSSCLVGTPTYIYLIIRMESLLTNQGVLASQVAEAIQMDLYEWNIEGGSNTMVPMEFSNDCMDEVIKLVYVLYNK